MENIKTFKNVTKKFIICQCKIAKLCTYCITVYASYVILHLWHDANRHQNSLHFTSTHTHKFTANDKLFQTCKNERHCSSLGNNTANIATHNLTTCTKSLHKIQLSL